MGQEQEKSDGADGDTSKAVQKRQEYYLEKLDEFADKMQMIGFHPLAPSNATQVEVGEVT